MNISTLAALGAAAATIAGGCGDDVSDRPAATGSVVLTEYAIDMPNTISGPLVDLAISNVGAKPHELGIALLEPGTTLAEATAFVAGGGEQGEVLVDDPGGIGIVGAGSSLGYTRSLTPGTYVFFCSLPAPDGESHAGLGMIDLFEVTDGDASPLPDTELTISLGDEAIELPALAAGSQRVTVVNRGTRPHELAIAGVPQGTDLGRGAEIGEWIIGGQVGPPPLAVAFAGGVKSIQPGVSVVLTVTLLADHTYLFSDNSGDAEIAAVVDVA